MIHGFNRKVSRRLFELQAEKISVSQLKDILYDSYERFYIWGRTEKENKSLKRVEVYSVAGPGGFAMGGRRASNKRGPRYWTDMFVPEGYVILYNVAKGGFRTYPVRKITKVEKDKQLYTIK